MPGNQIWSGAMTVAVPIPDRANKKTGTIKTINAQQAVLESYHGEMVRLNDGDWSSCMGG